MTPAQIALLFALRARKRRAEQPRVVVTITFGIWTGLNMEFTG